jgi:hypothetical protein
MFYAEPKLFVQWVLLVQNQKSLSNWSLKVWILHFSTAADSKRNRASVLKIFSPFNFFSRCQCVSIELQFRKLQRNEWICSNDPKCLRKTGKVCLDHGRLTSEYFLHLNRSLMLLTFCCSLKRVKFWKTPNILDLKRF